MKAIMAPLTRLSSAFVSLNHNRPIFKYWNGNQNRMMAIVGKSSGSCSQIHTW